MPISPPSPEAWGRHFTAVVFSIIMDYYSIFSSSTLFFVFFLLRCLSRFDGGAIFRGVVSVTV